MSDMKILNYSRLIIAFLLIALTSKGQYVKLLKGDPAPYEGVLISLPIYRTETLKLKMADQVINGLQTENKLLSVRADKSDTLNHVLQQRNEIKDQQLDSKTEAFSKLNKEFFTLSDKYAAKFNWWNRNKWWVCGGGGFVLGVIGYRYLTK